MFHTVKSAAISDALAKRFQWLSAGDVRAQQELLNHFMHRERQFIVAGLAERAPSLLRHMREHGDVTERLAQEVEVGRHKLEVLFAPDATGVTVEEPFTYRGTRQPDWAAALGCVIYGLIILGSLLLVHALSG